MSEFKRDITETKSCVFLRAEDKSKTRIILSDDERSFLMLIVFDTDCLWTLSSDGFSVYRKNLSCHSRVPFVLLMLR